MIRSPGAFFAAHHSRECFPDLLVPLSMRSVLGESALEAGFRSIVELVGLLYDKLPAEHDPVWDTIYLQAEEYFRAAQTGASIGMAYHLLVDGLVQEAPYKDLPISMPMEAHQAVFVANGVAETIDADAKPGTSKFTGDRAEEESRHKKHRSARLAIDPAIDEMLFDDERSIIHRYGAWMLALTRGDIQPLTTSQEQFIDVAMGKRKPLTEHENAWWMYLGIQRVLANRNRPPANNTHS